VLALCVLATPAWGQEAPSRESIPASPAEPAGFTLSPVTVLSTYPVELLGLLGPAKRGPLTLTPSIAVSEEYNDNIFSSNENRQSDFITEFSPAITLSVNQPSYSLVSGYSATGSLYAKENEFNNVIDHQDFVGNGEYRLTPGLTLTASETFSYSRNTNTVSSQGFSTGREKSWSNNFNPGMTWQMTALNSLNLSAGYDALRFLGNGTGDGIVTGTDSDTFTFQGTVGHAFTPRLTASIGYGFTYINIEAEPSSSTHIPTLGFTYQVTRTLDVALSGGPAITLIGGDTSVTGAGNASIVQKLPFGSAALQYSQGVSAAGGFGSTSNTGVATGTLTVSTLLRDLFLVLSPAYSWAKSVSSQQANQTDVNTFTLALGATYQIFPLTKLFGSYTFLYQRTGGASSSQVDVDQNRVRFGVQLGYPINFD
jgi:hypothetical protein